VHIGDLSKLPANREAFKKTVAAAYPRMKPGAVPVIVAHRLTLCTLLTQAVWKRFSYPNNSKQPGVMDLDATV